MLGIYAFLSSADLFLKKENSFRIQSECQTIWIQIRADVCNGYQQTTLASKESKKSNFIEFKNGHCNFTEKKMRSVTITMIKMLQLLNDMF